MTVMGGGTGQIPAVLRYVLRACMYEYMYIYIYIRIFACMYVHVCLCVCVYICGVHTGIHICVRCYDNIDKICMCFFMHLCMHKYKNNQKQHIYTQVCLDQFVWSYHVVFKHFAFKLTSKPSEGASDFFLVFFLVFGTISL
jgi:hypothetical protein